MLPTIIPTVCLDIFGEGDDGDDDDGESTRDWEDVGDGTTSLVTRSMVLVGISVASSMLQKRD